MKSRVIVSAIIKKGSKYLLGKKPKDIPLYPNTWHLLGGGIRLDEEKLEEALRREIKEEAGIEIANIKRLSFDEDYENNKNGEMTHYLFLVFEVECKSDEVKPNDDITELKWFTKEQLKTIPITRPSIKLFREIGLF